MRLFIESSVCTKEKRSERAVRSVLEHKMQTTIAAETSKLSCVWVVNVCDHP